MTARYQNIQENPPDYNTLSNPDPPNVPLIMIPVQKEIRKVSERQSRNQLIKRYACAFFFGFIILVTAFFVGNMLWKKFENLQPEDHQKDCQKRVIGYYSGWDNRNVSVRQIEKLTHLIFIGTKITADGKVEFKDDEQRLLFFDMKNKASSMKSGVKVLFSTDSYSYNYELVALVMKESKTRRVWVDSISSFILEQQLDGVELYYRFPESKEDKENYVFFIRELRYKLEKLEKMMRRKVPFIISVITAWNLEPILLDLMDVVDIFNVENDNFYSPTHTERITGPLSPLFSMNSDRSIDTLMKKLVCKTKKPNKFGMTISFRGSYFNNVKNALNESDPLYRSVDLVDGKSEGALVAWSELENRGFDLSKSVWHEESKTNYIWDWENQKLYIFDDERSLKEKVSYAVLKNLGGVVIRELEYDDNANTLLNAVSSIDMCPGPYFKKDEVKYDCEND